MASLSPTRSRQQAALLPIARQAVQCGPVSRPMVGIYHYPKPSEPGCRAALLCNPFGQEAIRAQRVFMVLADRLAQLGVPTLRFDYHGTGDSPGDDLDGELSGWAGDILSAQQKLETLARPSASVWIGLRLGALLAASASALSPSPVSSLILWEPVLDGKTYLRELAIADRAARLQGFSLNKAMYRELQRQPYSEEPAEALGFALSPALRQQLGAADGKAFQQTRSISTAVITSCRKDAEHFTSLQTAEPPATQPIIHHLDLGVDWATNDAGGGTIAPAEVVRLIIPMVLDVSR